MLFVCAGAEAAVVCYDLTDGSSFEKVCMLLLFHSFVLLSLC